MILKCPYGAFGGFGSMFFWWYSLEGDIVFLKSVFEILGASVIRDVKFTLMTMFDEELVGVLPNSTDVGGLTVGNSSGMDRVGVVVIEDEDVMVTPTGDCRKFTSLVGIRLDDVFGWNKH